MSTQVARGKIREIRVKREEGVATPYTCVVVDCEPIRESPLQQTLCFGSRADRSEEYARTLRVGDAVEVLYEVRGKIRQNKTTGEIVYITHLLAISVRVIAIDELHRF